MKFNNRTLVIIVVVIFCVLYFGLNILPTIFIQNMANNSQVDNFQRNATVETDQLDIRGMSVITRSDKVYYSPEGPIPTNKIWSSVVFKGQIEGLYTFPFASNTKDGTLNITLPKKYAYERIVTAQLISQFLSIKGSDEVDKVSVESYSDLSVKLNFVNKYGSVIFSATYIQGSPYIFIKPKQSTLNLSSAYYNVSKASNDWVYSFEDKNIGVFSNGKITETGNNLQINFDDVNGGYLTIAAIDLNHFDEIKSYAGNLIDSVNASFELKDSTVNVTYSFRFTDQNVTDTIFGLLPHQYANGGFDLKNSIFNLNTLRGDEYFVKVSNALNYSILKTPMVEDLQFEVMDPTEKTYISSLIERDLKDIVYVRSSAYFGGNDILKLGNLLEISNRIGNTDLVNRIKTRLAQEFDEWFNYKTGASGKYFAYDEAWGGIIGYETSGFGGENFNDHHFQYGYFIHAAAILAKYDTEFVTKYGYFIDNLVSDILTLNKDNKNFPYMRYFDQYEGHSWATGLADFSDGNNQESSSEAINAWYGVWLWSKVTGNTELNNTAQYLYSAEINATKHYWLNWYDNTSIFPAEFKRNKASVIWGGKVEYQTFFSLEPQSIEGIQYLPITPGALYLYNPQIIQRDYDYFKDYLADTNANLIDMNYSYYAMLKGFGVFPKALIESMKIDQGNSRANLYYWTKFWDNVKSLTVNPSGTYQVTYKDGVQVTL